MDDATNGTASGAAAAPTEVLSFGGEASDQQIFFIVKGYPRAGHLKISAAGMAFKEKKSGKKTQIHKPDMKSLRWVRVGRGHQLQIGVKGAEIWFDGFRNTQKEQMNEFFDKAFPHIPIETEDVAVSGWNWGDYQETASALKFIVDDKCAFEIPFSAIEKAQSASKHETSIEFALTDDDKTMQMVESMRFHFTSHPDDDERDTSRPEELKDIIMRRIDTETGGASIAEFKEVMCMNPRGKYDFTFFPSYVHLHGKSADFKIAYSNVKRLFLLTAPDHVPKKYLVWTVDPPIRHNLKRYHILPFQFETGVEVEVALDKPDVDDVPKRLAEMAETESGELVEIVARMLKLLSKSKLLNAGQFRSANGNECVKASVKNVHDGFLYPLDKAFLFIFKYPTYIRYEEVGSVSFERVKASESLSRSFDLEVARKDGETVKFTSIPKNELDRLKEYFVDKKLNITSLEEEADQQIFFDEDDEEEDEYTRRVRAEGRERGAGSDSEEDGDYEMGEESSVDEEYGSDDDSDIEAATGEKKTKKRKSRASGDEADGDDDDDEDDDEDEDGDGEEKKKKKMKKKKDPNAPKKPPNAWQMFSQTKRDEIKETNPEASFSELSKLVGAQWSALTDEEKQPFEEKAEEAKAKWKDELEKYYEEHPEAKAEFASPSKAAKKRKTDGPKKPTSSYMYYLAARRDEVKEDNPELKQTELMKLMAEQWKEMSTEDKADYEEKATVDRERYVKEKEQYRQARIAAGEEDPAAPKRRKSKGGDPNAPKKPLSSYMIFSSAMRDTVKEENPEASTTELSKLLGAKWQDMSDADKEKYVEEAKELKEKYLEELDKYYEEHPEAKAAKEASRTKSGKSKKNQVDKNQSKLTFKSNEILHSSDDVDSDNEEAIEAMLAKAKAEAD